LDYAPYDIRVNADLPWFCVDPAVGAPDRGPETDGPGVRRTRRARDLREVVKRTVPLGREQTVDDIGHLAAFLASAAARNITGQWIAVDGGITLRQAQ
jgi:NAD(P)-dependent dehydrogenase (short-subunit alcohol dehydrogenase family)